MLLSVVIPTFNSPPSLDRLLLSLSKQKLAEHKLQVICVNNMAKFMRSDLVKKWSDFFYDFKYMNSAKVGANTARNTGVRFSSGEIIWFLDDDCELIADQDYITKIIELHKTYPDIKGIGGLYYPPVFKNMVSKAYFHMTDHWLNQSKINQYLSTNLIGGNATYKREVFTQGHRFDSRLIFGATELSLNKSLTESGKQLALQNSLNVIHHQHLNILQFIKKAYRQGQGKAHLDIPFHSEPTESIPSLYDKLYSLFFKLGYSKESKNIKKKEFFIVEIIQGSTIYRLLHKLYLIIRHYTLQVVVKFHHMGIYHKDTYLIPLFKKIAQKK